MTRDLLDAPRSRFVRRLRDRSPRCRAGRTRRNDGPCNRGRRLRDARRGRYRPRSLRYRSIQDRNVGLASLLSRRSGRRVHGPGPDLRARRRRRALPAVEPFAARRYRRSGSRARERVARARDGRRALHPYRHRRCLGHPTVTTPIEHRGRRDRPVASLSRSIPARTCTVGRRLFGSPRRGTYRESA